MWKLVTALPFAVIVIVASVLLATREQAVDAGPAMAGVAAVRLDLLDLVAATDAAREQSTPALLDAAAVRLQANRDDLFTALEQQAGASRAAELVSTLDAEIGALVEAATAYVGGASGIGAGASAYERANQELTVLGETVLKDATERVVTRRQERERLMFGAFGGLAGLLVVGGVSLAAGRRETRERQQQVALSDLVSEAPIVFFRADADGSLVFVSSQVDRLLNVPAEALLGRRLDELFLMEPVPHGGRDPIRRGEWLDPSGNVRHVAISGLLREDGAGFERGWLRDYSTDHAQIESLRASEERLRTMLDHTEHGIAIVSGDGRILFHNQPLARLLGYMAADIEQFTVADLMPVEDAQLLMSAIGRRLQSDLSDLPQEAQVVRRDGSRVDVELVLADFAHSADEAAVVAEIRDITSRKQAAETLRSLTETDSLTGLVNRETFMNLVDDAVRHHADDGRHVAVAVFDLDRFHLTNDSYGHAGGDQLLRRIGRRLAAVAPAGHVVGRFGGDEFLLLMPDVADEAGAREAAERMMNAIRAIVVAPGDEVHLTASAGISLGPLHSESGEQLIRYAVNAMYDAKNAGRDRMHVFDPASEGVSRARLELEAALRGALDREEFEVFYQPQVDLRSGAIHAAEALVRWRHPEQGLIGPDVFIGLMEEVGLIGRLGEFVLRRACVDARDWADLTPAPVRVSVNLSPGQFLDDSLVDLVRETLAASGLPAELLELEITESTAMVNGRQALRMIEALRAEGVRVAIDDFGTGHSSLQRLNEFPVNVLKVDRSFVKALETDSRRALPVLKGIVALGQALGLEIVAEGIETEMQAFVLAGVRCDLGQGFLFSAAMPNEEMRAQLAAGVIRAGVRVA